MKIVLIGLLLLVSVWAIAKPKSKTVKIGLILTPGCRAADVVGFESHLRYNKKNEMYFVAENTGKVICGADFAMEANTTFEKCPELDVLFVGEMDESEIKSKKLINFIKRVTPNAKYVVGISNGVEVLYNAEVISNQKITADKETRKKLHDLKLNVCDDENFVVDGKIITARPSCGVLESSTYLLSKLHGDFIAKFVELALEYRVPNLYNGEIVEKPTTAKALKVGIFLDKGVYLPDVIGAVDAFSFIPNVEFYYLAKDTTLSNSFQNKGVSIYPNTKYEDAPKLDVLVVGAADSKYVKDEELSKFIINQEPNLSALISVCAGTFIVGGSGVLDGKNATTNYQQKKLLPMIGVEETDDIIVNDGKYFSSGPAVGTYVVAIKAIEQIVSIQWAKYIEANMLEFNPKSLYNIEEPKQAGLSLRAMMNLMSSLKLNPEFKKAIKESYYFSTKLN